MKKNIYASSWTGKRESIDLHFCSYTFLCLHYRDSNGPVCIASPAGGMDIETVALETPSKVKTLKIDILEGLTVEASKDLAKFLEFEGPLVDQVEHFIDLFKRTLPKLLVV